MIFELCSVFIKYVKNLNTCPFLLSEYTLLSQFIAKFISSLFKLLNLSLSLNGKFIISISIKHKMKKILTFAILFSVALASKIHDHTKPERQNHFSTLPSLSRAIQHTNLR